ncbi:MAG: M20/M25/M40 family metallo-hydrolase [Deltaproteobacteria bacterium]|nr:M20/M25/M40 family metallo-hydrolase [Deltaproteobacteria bacterium]
MSGLNTILGNAALLQSVGGLPNLITNMAPTPEGLKVIDTLESAVSRSGLKKDIVSEFRGAVGALRALHQNGGTPKAFWTRREEVVLQLGRFNGAIDSKLLTLARWGQQSKNPVDGISSILANIDASALFYLDQLDSLVATPSISDGKHLPNEAVIHASEQVLRMLEPAYFDVIKVLRTTRSNPSVFAWRKIDPKKPTVLFYAHFDVQPTGEGWRTDPFKLHIEEGRAFARGSADDKAGIVSVLGALEAYFRHRKDCHCNTAVFFEGEEEIQSPNLPALLAQLPKNFKPDVVVLTDTDNVMSGVPTITMTTRGLAAVRLEVETLGKEVHSGIHGGVVLDANLALAKILAALVDDNGDPLIEGLDTRETHLPSAIRKSLPQIPFDPQAYRKAVGMRAKAPFLGPPDAGNYERRWGRYVLDVIAQRGGDVDNPRGVIIPKASAIITLRVPPGQDSRTAYRLLLRQIKKIAPRGARVRLTSTLPPIQPWAGATAHPAVKKLQQAMTRGYGRQSVLGGSGGSIGFLDEFQRRFPGVPLLPIGVEDPFTNAHAANESLNIPDFVSTIRSLALFLDLMSRP